MFATKTPTLTAVKAAATKAETMHEDYQIFPSATGQKGLYVVQHKVQYRRAYVVDAVIGTCSCPAFKHDAVCKHQKFVHDEVWLREQEEGREDYADMLASYER
jgi:hypothetical protein